MVSERVTLAGTAQTAFPGLFTALFAAVVWFLLTKEGKLKHVLLLAEIAMFVIAKAVSPSAFTSLVHELIVFNST
jgi:hypothetical protein